MPRNLLLIVLSFLSINSYAQTTSLIVKLDDQNKPYLDHKIGVKENFYSIGRMYNISPRIFAPYNGHELTSGLSIGQVIRLPLNETNFWQTGSRKGNETVVPVYHAIQPKETVQTISKVYGTDKASLFSWNNLQNEKLITGQNLIIGFLKVDKTLSPLALQGMGPRTEPPAPKPVAPETEKKAETTPIKKNEEKKENQPEKETEKASINPPLKEKKFNETVIPYSGVGLFKEEFNQQVGNNRNTQTITEKGGSFKSTSGWSDGKFYILIDSIEKGRIVRLRNTANNKLIYAKVLAGISETKPGAAERFLISNSAASQLSVTGNNYELEISWVK